LKTYSLFDLNQFIRRVIALNLSEPIWVECEIGQCNESRGHYWLELVQQGEQEEEEIIAQAAAVIWSGQYRKLRKDLGASLQQLLQEGMSVKLKVKADFHERYGLKLIVEDIDPAYTLGKLAMQRQAILDRLRQEQLLTRNAGIPLPTVLQRIAVISSAKAAGYQDFTEQVQNNAYGYQYELHFFPSAMQGASVEKELLQQLTKIERRKNEFDVVVIIRGGGSKLDLQAFDNYYLGKKIAELSLPVLVGIGHDIDDTVLDSVAQQSLKTPTAVADFLIHHNEQFEIRIQQLALRLQQISFLQLREENLEIERLQQMISLSTQNLLQQEQIRIETLQKQLPLLAERTLQFARQQLAEVDTQIQLYDPEEAYKRGFITVTDVQGKQIRSSKSLRAKDIVNLHFADGSTKAKIEEDE
jgi:exodeoxyribonuclease VII large subunit